MQRGIGFLQGFLCLSVGNDLYSDLLCCIAICRWPVGLHCECCPDGRARLLRTSNQLVNHILICWAALQTPWIPEFCELICWVALRMSWFVELHCDWICESCCHDLDLLSCIDCECETVCEYRDAISDISGLRSLKELSGVRILPEVVSKVWSLRREREVWSSSWNGKCVWNG